jgi:hypothetical protein
VHATQITLTGKKTRLTWMRSSKVNMLFWRVRIPRVANRPRLEPIRQSSSAENLFT